MQYYKHLNVRRTCGSNNKLKQNKRCTSASHALVITISKQNINNKIHTSYVVVLSTESKQCTVLRHAFWQWSVNSMKAENNMSTMTHKIPHDRQYSVNIYNSLFPFHLIQCSMSHIDTSNKFIKNFSLDKYYRLKEPTFT